MERSRLSRRGRLNWLTNTRTDEQRPGERPTASEREARTLGTARCRSPTATATPSPTTTCRTALSLSRRAPAARLLDPPGAPLFHAACESEAARQADPLRPDPARLLRVRLPGGGLQAAPQLLPAGDALRRPADGDGVHERRHGRSADRGPARAARGAPRRVPGARGPLRRGRSAAKWRRRANGAAA